MNVLMGLFDCLFSPSNDSKSRKVIPSQPNNCIDFVDTELLQKQYGINGIIGINDSVTTAPIVANKSSTISLTHLPKLESEENVVSLLDAINYELYSGQFRNLKLSHDLYCIIQNVKNYRKLSHKQLEYIKCLNREQLYFLFLLSNQMFENLEAVLNKVGSPINQKTS